MFNRVFSQNDQSLHTDLQIEKFLHVYSEQHKEDSQASGENNCDLKTQRDRYYSLMSQFLKLKRFTIFKTFHI